MKCYNARESSSKLAAGVAVVVTCHFSHSKTAPPKLLQVNMCPSYSVMGEVQDTSWLYLDTEFGSRNSSRKHIFRIDMDVISQKASSSFCKLKHQSRKFEQRLYAWMPEPNWLVKSTLFLRICEFGQMGHDLIEWL